MGHSGQPEGWESQCLQPDPTPSGAGPAASLVKVLIVEDSLIVRERLAALIAEVRNVTIVGQAGDGFQAQALFRQHRPDAVVLDIQVPGINGMDLLAQFKREHPACVVMVSDHLCVQGIPATLHRPRSGLFLRQVHGIRAGHRGAGDIPARGELEAEHGHQQDSIYESNH